VELQREPSEFVELLSTEIAETLGWTPVAWKRIRRGYTPAARFRVQNGDKRAYVKIATTPGTVAHMQREIRTYSRLSGPFMPTCYGWSDSGTNPYLVLEDLGDAVWPPPWKTADIRSVLERLSELHAADAALPDYAEVHGGREAGWSEVACDPEPFLRIGVADRAWLSRNIKVLIEAEEGSSPEGNSATHWDIRSDNLCIVDGAAVLIDWGEACLSNPKLDLGFWLPSLAFEGGPDPEMFLPNEPEIAAWVAGFFAARAGLEEVPDAPFVRRVQREQLSTALPWACRALSLAPPC
jgi:hypothetical protein